MDEKITPKKSVIEIKELLESMEFKINNTSLIQDNKIIFHCDEKVYRCCMPNQRERAEAEDYKNKFYTKLLTEGGYKTRKQLKKLLKENQDIDIDVLELEKIKLQNELKEAYLSLAITLSAESDKIEELKNKISDIEAKHFDISLEISNLLSPSLDDRLDKAYIEYLTYLCTEIIDIKNVDEWSRVWNSYDEYSKDNGKLANKAVEVLSYLILNTRD